MLALSVFAAVPTGLSPNGTSTPVDIHTAKQKNFFTLNREARHEIGVVRTEHRKLKITDEQRWKRTGSAYPDGQIPNSGTFPKWITFTWSGTGPFEIEIRRASDNKLFFTQSGISANTIDVFNFEIGTTYNWTVKNASGTSAAASFVTDDIFPRMLWDHADGEVYGIREIGGCYVSNGTYRVKQGLVYRCSKLNDNAEDGSTVPGPSFITDASRSFWKNDLGVRYELDLRGDIGEAGSLSASPLGSPVAYRHISGVDYRIDSSTANRTAIRNELNYALDPSHWPLVFHCSIGHDRTGTLAILMHGLLGVSEDDMMRNYEASWFWYIKGTDQGVSNHYNSVNAMFDTLRTYNKSTMADNIEAYCKGLGITQKQINTFRAAMLEPVSSSPVPQPPAEPEIVAFDWLETDAKGYIKTDYVPNFKKTKIEIKARFLDSGVHQGLFIADSATDGVDGQIDYSLLVWHSSSGDRFRFLSHDNGNHVDGPAGFDDTFYAHTMTVCDKQATIDGSTIAFSTFTPQNRLAAGPLELFDFNYGEVGQHVGLSRKRVQYIKIWEVDGTSETLVRDYVAATNASGVATLYDRVHKKFETVSGTGAHFTVGNGLASEPDAPAATTGRRWTGKTVSVLGDSYSTWQGYTYVTNCYYPSSQNDVTAESQTWWRQVITEFDGTLGEVVAGGGSCISKDVVSSGKPIGSFLNRANHGELGNPDVIMIMGGLNDYWQHATAAELYAGCEALFNMLDANYPGAEKIMSIVKGPDTWNTGLPSEYRSAIRTSAENHGYTVVDLLGAYAEGQLAEGHLQKAAMTGVANRIVATVNGTYVPPAHVHHYGEWVVTTEPTASTPGERTKTCDADGCTYPLATITEVIPETGGGAVDPLDYGSADTSDISYTWKAGATGPWTYTTNWTPSRATCHGIPDASVARVIFPETLPAGTRVAAKDISLWVKKIDFLNTAAMTLSLDNAKIDVAEGSSSAKATIEAGATGPLTVEFRGAQPRITTHTAWSNGRLIFGSADESIPTTLDFALPSVSWTEDTAPLQSNSDGAPLRFLASVRFAIDAANLSTPAEGQAITNVLGVSNGDDSGIRVAAGSLSTVQFRNLPANTTGELVDAGETLLCVMSRGTPPEPPVDPLDYGSKDSSEITYTWKAGVSGPWEYTTSWTPSSTPCYGIPDSTKVTAVFPAELPAGTTVAITNTSIDVKKINFLNTDELDFIINNGSIDIAEEKTVSYGALVEFGATGPMRVEFRGTTPRIESHSEWSRGRLVFGSTDESITTMLDFELPASPWTAATAPLRSNEDGAPLRFQASVRFAFDAANLSTPAEGQAVTNVIGISTGDDAGIRVAAGSLSSVQFRNLPANTRGELINAGATLICVLSYAERTEPDMFSFFDFGGTNYNCGSYFVTDYVPNLSTTKILTRIKLSDYYATQSMGIIYAGAYSAGMSSEGWHIASTYFYPKHNRTPYVSYMYGNVDNVEKGFYDNQDYHFFMYDGATMTRDNMATVVGDGSLKSGEADGPLVIGAMPNGANSFYNFAKYELTYVKIWEKGTGGDTLVHDYFPSTNELGQACLYDRVTKEFLMPVIAKDAVPSISGVVIDPDAAPMPSYEHVHTWSDWRETVAPKLGVAGELERRCSTCNEIETAEVPALTDALDPTPFAPANTIICFGDSLTYGERADEIVTPVLPNYFDGRMNGIAGQESYPLWLAKLLPETYNVIGQAKSGKSTDAILSWFGGLSLKTTYEFMLRGDLVPAEIPANILYNGTDGGDQWERAEQAKKAWYYGMLTPALPLAEPIAGNGDTITGWLGGIHVRIGGNHSDERTVVRTEATDLAVNIPAGSTFVPDAAVSYRDAVKVILAGSNDGAEAYQRFISQIQDAVTNRVDEKYVVVSSHIMTLGGETRTQTTPTTIENAFAAAFGEHYLNLRLALVNRGISTAVKLGVMDAETAKTANWNTQGAGGFLCSQDTTHFNGTGNAVVAQFVKEKLQALEYVPADPEPEAEVDEFDWIKTDGVGVFVTDYHPNPAKTRMEMKVQFLDMDAHHGLALANNGTNGGEGNGLQWGACFYIGNPSKATQNMFQYYTDPDNEVKFEYGFNDTSSVHTITVGAGITALDGVTNAVGFAETDAVVSGPLALFAANWGTTSYFAQARVKCYGIRIWEIDGGTETLVRDYVATTNELGEATLYDKVNKEYLDPENGEGFEVGDDELAAPVIGVGANGEPAIEISEGCFNARVINAVRGGRYGYRRATELNGAWSDVIPVGSVHDSDETEKVLPIQMEDDEPTCFYKIVVW